MSEKGEGMEEINELRAKAIASMSSSANPTSKLNSKSPQSREEGELSSGEDEELPICSTAPSGNTTVVEPLPVALRNKQTQSLRTGNVLPANSSSSMANMQLRTSVKQNYSKQFKLKQVPFKSSNRQTLSWHGKGSDDNLVISFSDDDSGSDSQESKPERILKRKDNANRADRSKMIMKSSQIQSDVWRREPNNRTKPMPKEVIASRPPISSVTKFRGANLRGAGASSVENDPRVQRHNSILGTSASREHGSVPEANLADHKLESLRQQIAVRENELKVLNKPMPRSKESISGSYGDHHGPHIMRLNTQTTGIKRPASVISGSTPNKQELKRLKLDENSKISSDGQLQMLTSSIKSNPELRSQVLENSGCLEDKNRMGYPEGDKEICIGTIVPRPDKRHQEANTGVPEVLVGGVEDDGSLVPISDTLSSHEDHGIFAVGISCICGQSDKRAMPVNSSTILNQNSCLLHKAPNLEDGAVRQSDMSIPENSVSEGLKHSNILRRVDASNVFPNKGTCHHDLVRCNPNEARTSGRISLKTSDNIFGNCSFHSPANKLGNDENASLVNDSSQLNILGRRSMDLQSLVKFEELQDKELEEAQELRHRCELEERHALKAYRKAQRALLDANDRCTLLYRRRELFSAQLRAFTKEASSSMWSSSWQNHIPKSTFGLFSTLSHQVPSEGRVLDRLGYEPSIHCLDGAPLDASYRQMSGHDFRSDQFCEPDASTSDPKDKSALNGDCMPSNNPNLSTDEDEENFPFDNRSVESQLLFDNKEGNCGEGTVDVDVDVESERIPIIENAQDYELLEASLRSKLVARLGVRTSSKKSESSNTECTVDKGVDSTVENKKPSALSSQRLQEGEENQMSDLEGSERPERNISQLSMQIRGQSHYSKFSVNDALHRNPEESSSFPKESCWETCRPVFFLPSLLRIVSRHAEYVLTSCCNGFSNSKEKDYMLRISPTEVVDSLQNVGDTREFSMRSSGMSKMDTDMCDLPIDPFWPFCLFELRGKCNNEECSWQHLKNYSHGNSASHSGGQISHSFTLGKSNDTFGPSQNLCHHMSVPTYQIGSHLIKADSQLSQSVLSRSVWQYWQKGFCNSFSVPFSVHRILPPNAPFLQADGGHVADHDSWNRLSLYFRSRDGTTKQLTRGLPDSEQSLEMALDLVDEKFNKADRKKALSLLSRAIEADPNSVANWVVYLHIFYRKEKGIGKDDMFSHAVQYNEGSYDLWLMYINSRMRLGDRLNAYDRALSTLCSREDTLDMERKYISACILDIFLQMIDFLCMCGDVEKAILRIYRRLTAEFENFGDTLLQDIHSCSLVSDRCVFWVCCIYLSIYRKLPEEIVQQFEIEKDLPFMIEWPCIQLTTDKKNRALEMMKIAVDKVAMDIDDKSDLTALRSLHFLAVSHVRCVAALEGLHCSAELLAKYLGLYPTCIELALLSVRLHNSCAGDVIFKRLEEVLCNWPEEIPGIQCLWNQCAEYALELRRIDFAEKLMSRWFQGFWKVQDLKKLGGEDGLCRSFEFPSSVKLDGDSGSNLEDEIFGLLNLFLHRLLQKNLAEAHLALDKALKVAAPGDFKHCVREHAAFIFSNGPDSMKDVPYGVIPGLLRGYLGDARSVPIFEPLSRRYYRNIRKPRIRQLIDNFLGPVSLDFSLMNVVLEVCNGPSLLPEKFNEPKDFVDYIETLMEIMPSNYQLALSVYKFTTQNFSNAGAPSGAIVFWASSLLVNTIFQSIPVAPEHVWIEAANDLRNSKILGIPQRFHQQALSVYPFSIKLWNSYLSLSKMTGNESAVVAAARERSVELGQIPE